MSAASVSLPRWDLSDLYPGYDSPGFKGDLTRAAKDAAAFEDKYKGKVTALDAAGLLGLIHDYEALEELIGRLGSFAGLAYASDMADEKSVQHYGNTQGALNDLGTHLIFLDLELNLIEDDALAGFYAANDDLARYRPWLDHIRAMKPYQLDEQLETLLHEKSATGRQAMMRLFDETTANMTVPLGGKDVPMEEALNQTMEADGKKREVAATALSQVFQDNQRLFTLVTNTLAKDKAIEDKWRGLPAPNSGRHLANQVEPEVVDALRQAVQSSYKNISHRYYALKAKWLGVDQLNFWDRNAPLPDADERKIPWSDAQSTVLDAYGGFALPMADLAKNFFDKPWIDAELRVGKSPGAFSHPTVPSAHPYVLLNYQGTVRDVMTLAHELGHGVHQLLAAEQGALLADTPLTLAETASVFGEMLTFRSMLNKTEDPKTRRIMLANKVEDMINTVVRQIAFYEFELRLHDARKQGELSAADIGQLWMTVQSESLGPAIKLNEGYETWWCYIPHFIHSPFYVYAYAFGDCLVNALYQTYEEAEDGFAERYFDMLRAGGTKRHKELLAPFGLDASDPAFWHRGLNLISGFIDELEADLEG